MEKKLVSAYIDVLFSELLKSGSTFFFEACEAKKELTDPHAAVGEYLQAIDESPYGAFEQHWRTLARRRARMPR